MILLGMKSSEFPARNTIEFLVYFIWSSSTGYNGIQYNR